MTPTPSEARAALPVLREAMALASAGLIDWPSCAPTDAAWLFMMRAYREVNRRLGRLRIGIPKDPGAWHAEAEARRFAIYVAAIRECRRIGWRREARRIAGERR